jgi:hypothetical protein
MMLVGRGISDGIISEAFKAAGEVADNASLSRFAKVPVVANPNRTDIGIDRIDLSSLPDGFSYTEDITLGMYAIALARGIPARWLWPATATGATKADALLQHTAGLMAGTGATLQTLQTLLGGSDRGLMHRSGKFLPPHLKITFDFQDDEQDRAHAENASLRSQTRERDLNAGAITVRIAREQMLEDGEIDQAQFNQMELADGRTPEGLPIEAMFYATDNEWLRGIDVKDPDLELVEARLDDARRASVQETSSERKAEAWQAAAALEWLKKQGEGLAPEAQEPQAPVVPEETPEEGMEVTPDNQADQDEAEEEEETEVASLKLKQDRMTLEAQMRRELQRAMAGFEDDALTAIEEKRDPDWAGWMALLLAGMVPMLTQTAVASAMDLSALTGIMFDPAEVTTLASTWARGYGYELVKNITNTTQAGLQQAVSQYLSTPGMSRDQLAAMIDPLFGPVRAEMIAITETTRAMSQGMAEYRGLLEQQLGIKSRAFWQTAADDRVCLICAPLDGKAEEAWRADYPSGPPAHPRCRCKLRLKLSIGG